MKQSFITEVEQSLLSILDNAQMKALHEALTHALWGRDVVTIDSAEPVPDAQSNQQLLDMFFFPPSAWKDAAKRRCITTRPPSQSCCKPSISASCISPRTICASIWRIISRSADAAVAISTTSAAFYPASLRGWRMKTTF